MNDTEQIPDTIQVRISRATETVWEGSAYSVSATNTEGPFDVLPMHAHFLSVLENKPIVVSQRDGTTETFTFSKSVMHVKDNKVSIYADIA